jgi:predicted ATP-binding protein involved in virulence
MVEYEGNPLFPFRMLSDGVRCTLAMVMELAFRCYLLNPHLGVDAPLRTKGVVLIDEIDLHLHPSWQTHIINDLRSTFPEIQFFVTTHAPLVISQVDDCSIYNISEQQIYDFPNQNGRDVNYIVEQMGVPYIKSESKQQLDIYFGMIDSGKGKTMEALALRKDLEKLLGEKHAELKRADMLLSFF